MENKIINRKLNFLKGLACIGVVFIHIAFPSVFGTVISSISGFSVPVFFMVAGYFAHGKDENVIKRRLFKIIKILVLAYALNFVFQISIAASNHQTGLWLSKHFELKTPIKYICFCTIDFAIPLWYLIAMAETYFVWFFVVKRNKEKALLKFLPLLFALQIIINTYCDTAGLSWSWKINFVTAAMPWFLSGYYFNTEGADKFKNMPLYRSASVAFIGCIIAVVPNAFNLPVNFGVVGFIPYTFGMFALALKNPTASVSRIIEYIGQKLSLYIYILHVMVGSLTELICTNVLKINTTSIWLWCKPLVTLLFTIIISAALSVATDKIKMIKKSRLPKCVKK